MSIFMRVAGHLGVEVEAAQRGVWINETGI